MNRIEASKLARELMNQHGLNHVPLQWNRGKSIAGHCSFKRNWIDRSYTVLHLSLSCHFVELNNENEVKNVILHEIAHALAGQEHGHDYHWRKIARNIGCDAKRCYTKEEINMPKGRYKATCQCRTHYKHRLGKRVRHGGLICKYCRHVLHFVDTQSPVYA